MELERTLMEGVTKLTTNLPRKTRLSTRVGRKKDRRAEIHVE